MANRGRPKITTGIPRSEAERKALEEWKKIFSIKTIKLSANSIFKPGHAEQLINILFGRCYNATRIAYLGSLYALHVVNSHADANDMNFFITCNGHALFRECFTAVTQENVFSNDPRKAQLSPEFHALINEVEGFYWPTRTQLNNGFEYLCQQYKTNVTTNLTTWFEKRLLYFLKMKCYEFNQVAEEFDDIDVRNTMKNLLYNQDWTEGDANRLDKMTRLYTEVQRRCTPSFNRYLNMVQYVECKWFESLWFFIIIQREIGIFIEQHQSLVSAWINHKKYPTIYQQPDQPMPPKIQNFTVIPMCTTKLKHIKFDHTNLLALLSQMNVVPDKFYGNDGKHTAQSQAYFAEHKDDAWSILFNMDKIREICKPNQLFHYMILTDSVAASVLYDTPKRQPGELNRESIIQKIHQEDEPNKNFKYIISMDPGMKTYLAGVRRNILTGVEVNNIQFVVLNSCF